MAAALSAEADDDRARAAELIRRCARDVRAHLPEALPDWTWVAGRCATDDPTFGDARNLLRQAERGYREQDRPVDAAFACAALAELPGTGPEEAVALWTESADLVASSGEADEADGADEWMLGCALEAGSAAATAAQQMGAGEERRAAELIGAAHALSERHGPDELTAHLLALTALFGCGTVMSADEALNSFTRARALLGPPGPGYRTELAGIDLCEARVLLTLYRMPEAEVLLHRALPELRRSGTPDDLESAEVMLRMIAATGPPTDEDLFGAPERWSSPELRAGAEAGQAIQTLQSGRTDDAIAMFERATRTAADGGFAMRAAVFRGFAAILRLLTRGDLPGALHSLDELDRLRAEPASALDDVVRTAVVRALLAGSVAALTGDRPGYRRHLATLEDELVAGGVGLLAARIALDRARDMYADGDPVGALRVALPAALAVDSVRFSMPDPARRRRWTEVAAGGFDTAFRAAVATGRSRLVAELLEVVRGHAVPVVLRDPGDGGPGDLAGAIAALADVMGPAPAQAAPSGAVPSGNALSGPAVVGGDVGRTGLGLPPALRAPWSGGAASEALADALREASRYHRPLRSDAVAHWFPASAGTPDANRTPRSRPEQGGGAARIGER